MQPVGKSLLKGLMENAGFVVSDMMAIENQYQPMDFMFSDGVISEIDAKLETLSAKEARDQLKNVINAIKCVKQNKWFLVKTQFGPIEFGPRKRVWHLGWKDTPLRKKLPIIFDTTNEETYVHSWDLNQLAQHFILLFEELSALNNKAPTQAAFPYTKANEE